MKFGKLKRSWQFARIYKEGGRYSNDLFILYILPNGTQETRLGLTVTKKIGISVQRNRIKRLIREVLRSLNEIATGSDLVVVAKKATFELTYLQAYNSLKELLTRARLLKYITNKA